MSRTKWKPVGLQEKQHGGIPSSASDRGTKSGLTEFVQLILDEPDSDEVPAFEEEIDALVYQLYGLTDAEIALIEGNR